VARHRNRRRRRDARRLYIYKALLYTNLAGDSCIPVSSRSFDRAFTLSYARLWRAIVTADADAMRAEAETLGVGPYYTLLAAMLTARPWSDILRAKREPEQLQVINLCIYIY